MPDDTRPVAPEATTGDGLLVADHALLPEWADDACLRELRLKALDRVNLRAGVQQAIDEAEDLLDILLDAPSLRAARVRLRLFDHASGVFTGTAIVPAAIALIEYVEERATEPRSSAPDAIEGAAVAVDAPPPPAAGPQR